MLLDVTDLTGRREELRSNLAILSGLIEANQMNERDRHAAVDDVQATRGFRSLSGFSGFRGRIFGRSFNCFVFLRTWHDVVPL